MRESLNAVNVKTDKLMHLHIFILMDYDTEMKIGCVLFILFEYFFLIIPNFINFHTESIENFLIKFNGLFTYLFIFSLPKNEKPE